MHPGQRLNQFECQFCCAEVFLYLSLQVHSWGSPFVVLLFSALGEATLPQLLPPGFILPIAHHISCCPLYSAYMRAAGGNGYINDFPMGRLLRDAKLYEIGAGTSEVRRLVIGRAFNADFR